MYLTLPVAVSLQGYARHLRELQDDLKASRSERERLEQSLDAVRKDLRVAQNSDVAYAQIYRENERLKHEVKRLKKDSSMDPDSERAYYDRKSGHSKELCVHSQHSGGGGGDVEHEVAATAMVYSRCTYS